VSKREALYGPGDPARSSWLGNPSGSGAKPPNGRGNADQQHDRRRAE